MNFKLLVQMRLLCPVNRMPDKQKHHAGVMFFHDIGTE